MDSKVFNVCRVCMIQEKSIPFAPFFDGRGKYSKNAVFMDIILGVKIQQTEGIPTLICSRCVLNLAEAVKYRNSVLKANEKYEALLRKYYDPLQEKNVTENVVIKQEPTDELEIHEDYSQFEEEVNQDIKSEQNELNAVEVRHFLDPGPAQAKSPQLQSNHKKSRKVSHKTLKCTLCDDKFCNDFERQEHIRLKHKKARKKVTKKRPTPEGGSAPSEWMCSYCGAYFEDKFDMLLHRKRMHEKEESTLRCPHCNKLFSKLVLLRSHIKTMHSEKQFMCPKCGRCFANKSFFELHLKKENNQKDFVCEICSSCFYSQSQLNMHMRRHSEFRPFQCDVQGCGMSFKCKSSIVKHIQVVHLNLKPYVCEFCSHSFGIRHHLKGHLKRVHLIAEGQNQGGIS